MRHLAALTLLALATAGCIGSSGAGSTPESTARNGLPPEPRTAVTVTYTVRACPPGAYCKASATETSFIISRRLACSPGRPTGDYPNPDATCRALADLVTKFDRTPNAGAVCYCPGAPLAQIPPKAVGYVNGERRTIALDSCTLCQISGLGDDLLLLMPGAVG